MFDVRIARVSRLVCTTVGSTPAFFSSRPPRRACSSPSSVRSTSTQPVNRFFLFQSLSPWRSRISVAMRPILSHSSPGRVVVVVEKQPRGSRCAPLARQQAGPDATLSAARRAGAPTRASRPAGARPRPPAPWRRAPGRPAAAPRTPWLSSAGVLSSSSCQTSPSSASSRAASSSPTGSEPVRNRSPTSSIAKCTARRPRLRRSTQRCSADGSGQPSGITCMTNASTVTACSPARSHSSVRGRRGPRRTTTYAPASTRSSSTPRSLSSSSSSPSSRHTCGEVTPRARRTGRRPAGSPSTSRSSRARPTRA